MFMTAVTWAHFNQSETENTPEAIAQKIRSCQSAIVELQAELNSLSPEDLDDFVVRDSIANVEKSLFRQLALMRKVRGC
jgi:hypothetical protein